MPLNHLPAETRQRVSHGIAGAVMLIKAFDKHDHGYTAAAAVTLAAGIFFLLFAALHPLLHHLSFHRHLETAALLAEAAVFATISATYFQHGKHALPWAYAAVAAAYLVLALRQHRRNVVDHPVPH